MGSRLIRHCLGLERMQLPKSLGGSAAAQQDTQPGHLSGVGARGGGRHLEGCPVSSAVLCASQTRPVGPQPRPCGAGPLREALGVSRGLGETQSPCYQQEAAWTSDRAPGAPVRGQSSAPWRGLSTTPGPPRPSLPLPPPSSRTLPPPGCHPCPSSRQRPFHHTPGACPSPGGASAETSLPRGPIPATLPPGPLPRVTMSRRFASEGSLLRGDF